MGFYSLAGGRVELGYSGLLMLVEYALDVDRQLISGVPDWATKVRYDINAIPPDSSPSRKLNLPGFTGTPTPEQREMILNLLVERFGLKYHVEEREMPVYFLERGKGPIKLEPPEHPERAADPRGGLARRDGFATGEGFGSNLTMGFLARQLMWPLERPVLDRTGIRGAYDFRVEPIEPENQDVFRGRAAYDSSTGAEADGWTCAGADDSYRCRNAADGELRPASRQALAGWRVRTVTSGGQLRRKGTPVVPMPRLT